MKKIIAFIIVFAMLASTAVIAQTSPIQANVDFEDQTENSGSLSLSAECGVTWAKHLEYVLEYEVSAFEKNCQ